MILTHVSTTLVDSEGYAFRPGLYSFDSEQLRSEWKDAFEILMADFSCDIESALLPDRVPLVYFEDDTVDDLNVRDVAPAPDPERLVYQIRELWKLGELDLPARIAVAA